MQDVEISNSPRFLKVAELAELLNKQTTLEAKQENEHEATKDCDELTSDSPALQQQQRPLDHSRTNSSHPDSGSTKPASSR